MNDSLDDKRGFHCGQLMAKGRWDSEQVEVEQTSSLRKGDKALFPMGLAFKVAYGSKEPHLPSLESRAGMILCGMVSKSVPHIIHIYKKAGHETAFPGSVVEDTIKK